MAEVGIIICSRLNSSRIPGKVLQKIDNRVALEVLLDNVINTRYQTILAIPEDSADDPLVDVAVQKGVEVWRGHDNSPLHRLEAVANEYGFDYIVRITHDDILIDQILMFNMVNMAIGKRHDYVFAHRCPEGTVGEIIKTEVLSDIVAEVGNEQIEYVSYYIKKNYRSFEYYPPPEYQFPYRLVMDFEEDLMLLRIIFNALRNPGTLDIINFLKKHTYFTKINKLPETTVYTCNYNTGEYIVECMESVFNSDYGDFEYIIIDDCSTDNSMDIITTYVSQLSIHNQRKVKVIRNEENTGLPGCCNKILDMARGRYIVRIDSDDYIHTDFFSKMLESIKIENSHGAISGYERVNKNSVKIDSLDTNQWHPGCAVLSKWAANEIKYQEHIEYGEGKPFFNEWKKKYNTVFIPEPLWAYRKREGQKTQDKEHPDNVS